MYCRECGNILENNDLVCHKCSTHVGYGVNYCQNCGYYTNSKLDFCHNCGAKLSHKLSMQKQLEKINELNWRAKNAKKLTKIFKLLSIACIIIFLCLLAFFLLRPQPADIHMARKSNAFFRIGNDYYYDSSHMSNELATFWLQSRELISYMICSIIFFISFIITKIILHKKYKQLITVIKEEKNVL